MALAVAGKRQMLLEIKTDERRQRYPEIEEKVFAVLDRHRFTPFTVVMAFEGETWRRVRQAPPRRAGGRALLGADAAGRRRRRRSWTRCARPA